MRCEILSEGSGNGTAMLGLLAVIKSGCWRAETPNLVVLSFFSCPMVGIVGIFGIPIWYRCPRQAAHGYRSRIELHMALKP
jgi:hypothetical protein